VKWTEKVVELKGEQYEKKAVLAFIQSVFAKRKTQFTAKHKLQFEQAWRTTVRVDPTVEMIVPEIDLPEYFLKLKPFQETQIINVFKHLDRHDIERRWKLVNIALNLAGAKNKQKKIDTFTRLSDIIFKSKMIKRQKITSAEWVITASDLDITID
jgi:hypothetical protein